MKANDTGPRGNRRKAPGRLSPLPVEWMDPMSWRLPSGKALAEFALQSGFLAPLMMGGPKVKPKKWSPTMPNPVVALRPEEVPENSGTFREAR